MGITLDWANYPDLGTSCGPSLSLTVDKTSLPFKKRLGELTEDQRSRLQLWIQLVWKDKLRKERDNYDGATQLFRLEYYAGRASAVIPRDDRGRETLARTEALIQGAMWTSVAAMHPPGAG